MTKMPRDVTPNALLRALQKAGFVIDRQTGSHARLKHPDGRATSVAIHPKPIFHGILRKILKEIKMTQSSSRRC